MEKRIGFLIGAAALAASLAAGCAGPGGSRAPDITAPAPTQTPWIIEQTVVVTRLVEVVATSTEVPATPEPSPTPVKDLEGARDLVIVPRPPVSTISGYATTRKHLFLDYSYPADGPSASDIADYFVAEMEEMGWELSRLETVDDRHSLTFEPGESAAEPMTEVDYVRILVRGDIGEIAIVVNTLREVADWEVFFGS